MNGEFKRLESLLISILGQPKKTLDEYSMQIQFDCPVCSMNKGLYDGDGKHNLEINLSKLKFNCWVCGQSDETHGSLSKLFRMFGNASLLNEYKAIIFSIKQSKLYEIQFSKNDFNDNDDDDFFQESALSLPNGFKFLDKPNKNNILAYKYLYDRNIGQDIIDKFNIGYVHNTNDKKLKDRIIIPSYDKFKMINYWVGRDYINDKRNIWKTKYANPNVNKCDIIFNEGKINWYDNVTLVEGPFDHIVIPNSIPLLGKVLKQGSLLFNTLFNNVKSNVYIFLDDDAQKDAIKIYSVLNQGRLNGKVFIIPCPDKYDAALLYQMYGKKGICEILKTRIKVPEYQLLC